MVRAASLSVPLTDGDWHVGEHADETRSVTPLYEGCPGAHQRLSRSVSSSPPCGRVGVPLPCPAYVRRGA